MKEINGKRINHQKSRNGATAELKIILCYQYRAGETYRDLLPPGVVKSFELEHSLQSDRLSFDWTLQHPMQ